MSVALTSNQADVINPYYMQDGQLGVIVTNPMGKAYEGMVVQKYGLKLITVGYPIGGTWSTLNEAVTMRVRLLKAGDTITVVDNFLP